MMSLDDTPASNLDEHPASYTRGGTGTSKVSIGSQGFSKCPRIDACRRRSAGKHPERLLYYSWNQVFAAVDRLSRKGIVTVQQQDSSDDILSLAPAHPLEKQDQLQA